MIASENIAFRRTSDRIFTENNGKFFKFVELFSKFDTVLEKHVKRAGENPKKPHYLGKNVQQKIILLIAKATKDNILKMVKNAMYFSVIVDYTLDASHKEQMSIVLRYVHITKLTKGNNASVEVKETFLEFINILDSTAAKMTDIRWESHVNAVSALKSGLKGIYSASKEVVQLEKDALTRITAESIASKLDSFEFICRLIIWQDVLSEINCTSKLLQSQSMDVRSADNVLKKTTEFLISRNSEVSFAKYISEAKVCAIDTDLINDFRPEVENRIRKRTLFFGEESEAPESINPKMKFKRKFFQMNYKLS
ncbi:uncharacterized protein LOC136078899 [Hydra vulgaris]|uniref:Uncharacterized protein LOC136078899 n=1 Tax=Hydra vulgaris TaxID=6087 RepID=A0ABM4BNU4_HYDVU